MRLFLINLLEEALFTLPHRLLASPTIIVVVIRTGVGVGHRSHHLGAGLLRRVHATGRGGAFEWILAHKGNAHGIGEARVGHKGVGNDPLLVGPFAGARTLSVRLVNFHQGEVLVVFGVVAAACE